MADPWQFDLPEEGFKNGRLAQLLYKSAMERSSFLDIFPFAPSPPRPWYRRAADWFDANVAWRFARVRPDRDPDDF